MLIAGAAVPSLGAAGPVEEVRQTDGYHTSDGKQNKLQSDF
jgi:hypothetical protein